MAKSTDDPDLDVFAKDAKRKQLRIPPPKKVAEALSTLFARQGYARVLATSAFETVWNEAVGTRLASHTRVGQIKRGVLEVIVRSSAVLQELTFAKSSLIKRLQSAEISEKVRDVKFKVGPIE